MQKLDEETPYMLFNPGERNIKLTNIENFVDSTWRNDGYLVGAVDDENNLIGYLSAQRAKAQKIRHTAYIVVGIVNQYQGRGVGYQLFARLHKWAEKASIHRLELTVMETNSRAVKLYEKMGFKKEGLKIDSIFMNDTYINEYYMAKIISMEDQYGVFHSK